MRGVKEQPSTPPVLTAVGSDAELAAALREVTAELRATRLALAHRAGTAPTQPDA